MPDAPACSPSPGFVQVDDPPRVTASTSRCPRCGGGFECGAAGPAPCACTGLALAPALLAELRCRYEGCLCLRCLRELALPQAPCGE